VRRMGNDLPSHKVPESESLHLSEGHVPSTRRMLPGEIHGLSIFAKTRRAPEEPVPVE